MYPQVSNFTIRHLQLSRLESKLALVHSVFKSENYLERLLNYPSYYIFHILLKFLP